MASQPAVTDGLSIGLAWSNRVQQFCNERRGDAYSAPYVEPLRDTRTRLDEWRVPARQGRVGERDFFNGPLRASGGSAEDMKALHCPNCGTPFVRVTYQTGMIERVLNQLNVFPFRCQLCMNKFRAFHKGAAQSTQAFDRRQYKRLPTSIEAQFLADNRVHSTNRITDISMDGCTLQTTGLPRGTFLGLVLKPDQEDEAIRIETAMVCSVRPTSVGLRFLEIPLPDQRRLSQVVLGLLVGQGPPPASNA